MSINLDPVSVYVPREVPPDEFIQVNAILVNDGSNVVSGQILMEIETSKATLEILAPTSGTVLILTAVGQRISYDSVLAKIEKLNSEISAEEKTTSLSQVNFTRAAEEIIVSNGLSKKMFVENFPGCNLITSNLVNEWLTHDANPKPIFPNASNFTIFVLGHGHRGRFLRELLQNDLNLEDLAFLDYSDRPNGTSPTSEFLPPIFQFDRFFATVEDGECRFYWNLPNTLSENRIISIYEKVKNRINGFVSNRAFVAGSSQLDEGVICFPLASVSAQSKIGSCSFLETGSVLGYGVEIGRFVSLNTASSVAHDSTIGDFTSVSDGARVAGRVTIGKHCLIGLNATVNSDLKIGDYVTVNSGANVYQDIPDYSIVTRDGQVLPKSLGT